MAKAKQGPEKHVEGTRFIVLQASIFPEEFGAFKNQDISEFKTYQEAKEFASGEGDGTYAIFELKSVFSVVYEAKMTELK